MPKVEWVSPSPRVEKPWGHEIHFALVDGKYCGKALHIREGHALSLQFHVRKEETVSVQSGRLLFEVGPPDGELESFELLPGESVHLRPGTEQVVWTNASDNVSPPKVPEKKISSIRCIRSARPTMAEIGMPLPMDFPNAARSGVTP